MSVPLPLHLGYHHQETQKYKRNFYNLYFACTNHKIKMIILNITGYLHYQICYLLAHQIQYYYFNSKIHLGTNDFIEFTHPESRIISYNILH